MKNLLSKVTQLFSFNKSRHAAINRELSSCASLSEVESQLRSMEAQRSTLMG